MFANLFRRLTNRPKRGQDLFDRAVEEARRPHWYRQGQVPDTIDGRFAALATICALLIVRLESVAGEGDAASAALTERFIEIMDAEHRQLGLNDPGLGRRVRKLVRSLERRVDEWRTATAGGVDWDETLISSLYRGTEPVNGALTHSRSHMRRFWQRLNQVEVAQVAEGQF